MANNATISVGWKIEDAGNGFRTVTMSAEDLRRVLRATVVETESLRRNFVNFAAVCTSIDSVSNTLDSLKSVVDDLAGAYDIQIEAETRLEQVIINNEHREEEENMRRDRSGSISRPPFFFLFRGTAGRPEIVIPSLPL